MTTLTPTCESQLKKNNDIHGYGLNPFAPNSPSRKASVEQPTRKSLLKEESFGGGNTTLLDPSNELSSHFEPLNNTFTKNTGTN